MTHKTSNTSKVRVDQVANTPFENIYLGLDLHKKSIVVTRIIDGATPERPRRFAWDEFWKFALEQKSKAKQIHAVYEAGAFGFFLQRQLQQKAVHCLVMHPEKLDPRNRNVRNDNLDSINLALRLQRYVGGNKKAMTVVYVPTHQQEMLRLAARHRDQLHKELQSLRARGNGLLLTQGIFDNVGWEHDDRWEKLSWRLDPALVRVLEDLRESIQHVRKQLRKTEKELTAAAPAQVPRGFGRLTFELLRRLLCDYNRFKNRRQMAGFTGLCGGVSASGDYHLDLSINKAGNARVRGLLVELAWRMIFYQPEYKGLKTWKRLGAATAAKRRRKIAIVATARQLAVDVWKWQTGRSTPEQLGWVMAQG